MRLIRIVSLLCWLWDTLTLLYSSFLLMKLILSIVFSGFYVYLYECLPAWMIYTMCMPGACRGQKRRRSPELQLRLDVSHHVVCYNFLCRFSFSTFYFLYSFLSWNFHSHDLLFQPNCWFSSSFWWLFSLCWMTFLANSWNEFIFSSVYSFIALIIFTVNF